MALKPLSKMFLNMTLLNQMKENIKCPKCLPSGENNDCYVDKEEDPCIVLVGCGQMVRNRSTQDAR